MSACSRTVPAMLLLAHSVLKRGRTSRIFFGGLMLPPTSVFPHLGGPYVDVAVVTLRAELAEDAPDEPLVTVIVSIRVPTCSCSEIVAAPRSWMRWRCDEKPGTRADNM